MPQIALDIASDHPAFAGHFPGQPIVPGVVLLDTAKRAIELAYAVTLDGIAVAKFHSPALPSENLLLDYEMKNAAVRFEIRCDARKIAAGTFSVRQQSVQEQSVQQQNVQQQGAQQQTAVHPESAPA